MKVYEPVFWLNKYNKRRKIMRRSKIAIILLSLITVVTLVLGLSFTASAVNYGFFDKDDIDPDSYAYSMAVIGDTQSLT